MRECRVRLDENGSSERAIEPAARALRGLPAARATGVVRRALDVVEDADDLVLPFCLGAGRSPAQRRHERQPSDDPGHKRRPREPAVRVVAERETARRWRKIATADDCRRALRLDERRRSRPLRSIAEVYPPSAKVPSEFIDSGLHVDCRSAADEPASPTPARRRAGRSLTVAPADQGAVARRRLGAKPSTLSPVKRSVREARLAADVAHLDLRQAERRVASGAPSSGRCACPRSPPIASRSSSSEAPPRTSARRSWPRTREEAGVEAALGGEPRARAVAAERLRHRGDHADLAAAVAVAPALRDLAAVVRLDRLERELGGDRARRSPRAGTTSSSRQPFVAPTSMYSMKRRVWPLPRK